jgi:hypothetical protein
MLRLDAKTGYALPSESIGDLRSSQSYWTSLVLLALGLATIVSASAIVNLLVPLAVHFDAQGAIGRPELLLRPVYSLGILLIASGAVSATLVARNGPTLRGAILHSSAARAAVVLSVVFLSVLCGLFLYAGANPWFFQVVFSEDGATEDLTALLDIVAFVFFLAAFAKYVATPRWYAVIAAVMLGCGVASLLLGLEEINYGQRIFHWDNPQFLAANVQHESNLHNLLTYDDMVLYSWFGVCGIFLVLSALACIKRLWPRPWLRFAPDDSLLPLAAGIMTTGSHGVAAEVMETSAALFALLYSVQLLWLTSESGAPRSEAAT